MEVIFWPLATSSSMAGAWTVVVVTFHRYIAVCRPHHVKKFANLRVARYQASMASRCDPYSNFKLFCIGLCRPHSAGRKTWLVGSSVRR